METKEKGFEPFSKLPSFQSQFHSYAESNMMPEPSLPQVTPVPVPMSPNSVPTASPGGNTSLTQLTPINPLQTGLTPLSSPSFHTLTAVNTRPYGKSHFDRHFAFFLSANCILSFDFQKFYLSDFVSFSFCLMCFMLRQLQWKKNTHFSVSNSSSSDTSARNSNYTATIFGWASSFIVSTNYNICSTTSATTKCGYCTEKRFVDQLWT